MNNEINLAIRRKQRNLLVSSSRVRQLRLVALISLFCVGGFSVLLFIIISTSPLPSLRNQEQRASAALSANQEKFGKYLLLRSQLGSIKSLLSTRPNLSRGIDTFLSLIPQGIQVSQVALSESAISFAVHSDSLTLLQTFFDTVAERAQEHVVPINVSTSPITEASDGSYSFTIAFK